MAIRASSNALSLGTTTIPFTWHLCVPWRSHLHLGTLQLHRGDLPPFTIMVSTNAARLWQHSPGNMACGTMCCHAKGLAPCSHTSERRHAVGDGHRQVGLGRSAPHTEPKRL